MLVNDIVIIAENQIIYDTVKTNFVSIKDFANIPVKLVSKLTAAKFLQNCPKIDILIIDTNLKNISLPLYKIRKLINLTKNIFSGEELKLKKPIRLGQILQILANSLSNKQLFCSLNNKWIYDEKLAILATWNNKIELTEKENQIFKFLLLSKESKIDKRTLLAEVWHYQENIETSTVDTHLYNLKQKLPSELVEIQNNCCIVNISEVT
ncbi:MAG: winged helix-turn-helix domain-containing protein [Rickettsiaceae bacterium]|nr:winged helix-turn-helix domain-containing protein [Rickettsiaceae bacterium]